MSGEMIPLDYMSREKIFPTNWKLRYAIFVPMFAISYCGLAVVIGSMDSFMDVPIAVYSVIHLVAFPAFFIFHNVGLGQAIILFCVDALFWGLAITALWHVVSTIRRHRRRLQGK